MPPPWHVGVLTSLKSLQTPHSRFFWKVNPIMTDQTIWSLAINSVSRSNQMGLEVPVLQSGLGLSSEQSTF